MTKLHCTKCGLPKSIRMFRKRGKWRSSWCSPCQREANKENMRKKRAERRVIIILDEMIVRDKAYKENILKNLKKDV